MFTARYDCLIQINAAVTILDVYKLGDSVFGGRTLSLFDTTQSASAPTVPKCLPVVVYSTVVARVAVLTGY